MAIVSLAGLLKSSAVLWMLGISYNPPKEHRALQPDIICSTSYNYEYKTCDDEMLVELYDVHNMLSYEPGKQVQDGDLFLIVDIENETRPTA